MSNYNNELHKHKAADTIKWIVAFVLIIAIMGAVVCLALQVGGVFDFFKKDDAPAEEQSEDVKHDGGLHFDIQNSAPSMSPVDGIQGVSLAYALTAAAPDIFTKTLTATVEPQEAPDKSCDWHIEWQPDAEKASEPVTNYVTVTPSSDGSQTATVKCIKAFGDDKIIISVTTRVGGFSASCTCSYVGAIETISISTGVLSPSMDTSWNISMLSLDTNKSYDFDISVDNRFHSVGATSNFELVVECFGTVLFNNELHKTGSDVQNLELEGNALFGSSNSVSIVGGAGTVTLLKNLSIRNNKLHIECDDMLSAFSRKVGDRNGWSLFTYKGFKDNKPIYVSIKVKDKNSNAISDPILVKVVSAVSSVELSQNGIVF